jgi:hypothetical protein
LAMRGFHVYPQSNGYEPLALPIERLPPKQRVGASHGRRPRESVLLRLPPG